MAVSHRSQQLPIAEKGKVDPPLELTGEHSPADLDFRLLAPVGAPTCGHLLWQPQDTPAGCYHPKGWVVGSYWDPDWVLFGLEP